MSMVVMRRLISTPPVVEPPITPTTSPSSGTYRYTQPYLFQPSRAHYQANRLSATYVNAQPLDLEGPGPNHLYVDRDIGWPWDRVGGDFIDSTLARNPASPVPWVTFALAGSPYISTPVVTITTLLQFIQSRGRWNALLLGTTGGTRKIATKFNGTDIPPSISVTYTDGTIATLVCRIVAPAYNTGSAIPSTTAVEYNLPAFVEFDRPTKAVQSATLTFRVTTGSGGAANLTINILDPKINADPVVMGVAANYPGDVGLAGDGSIIGAMLTPDGSTIDQFVDTVNYNIYDEDNFEPIIWNRGGTDPTKLPTRALGKWVGDTTIEFDPPNPAGPKHGPITFVNSSYTGEGFEPLDTGVGAQRFFMYAAVTDLNGNPLTDGCTAGGSPGPSDINKYILLPEPQFGLLDHLFVRYYARFAAAAGTPYRMPIAKVLQCDNEGTGHFLQPSSPVSWTDCSGKWGIVPTHDTDYGGNSASSGSGFGYQMRLAWEDVFQDDSGPDLGGPSIGLHNYDFQRNPPGYNYGGADANNPGDRFGQRGGLGAIMYADTWYCIEHEVKLNTVFPGTSFANVSWTRSGTTATIALPTTANLTRPTLTVTACSDLTAIPRGAYTITILDGTRITITVPNAGGTSGTMMLADFLADGIRRHWVDGRLTYERTGMVFRTLPIQSVAYSGTTSPSYISGKRRAARELGFAGLWFNWLHGGALLNTIDRCCFISNLAYGTQYIGPRTPKVPQWLTTAGNPLLTWVPVPGSQLSTVANTENFDELITAGLTNALGQDTGYGRPLWGILGYCGAALKTNGSEMLIGVGGGGAGTWAGNDVRGLRLEDDSPIWRMRVHTDVASNLGGRYDGNKRAYNYVNGVVGTAGSPNAGHTYGGVHYCDAMERFYRVYAVALWSSGDAGNYAYIDSNVFGGNATNWRRGIDGEINGHPMVPPATLASPEITSGIASSAMFKHPVTEEIYIGMPDYRINVFNPLQNTIRSITNSSMWTVQPHRGVMAIDHTRQLLLFVTWGTTPALKVIHIDSPTAVLAGTLENGNVAASSLLNANNCGPGFVYDQGMDKFVWYQDDNWNGTGYSGFYTLTRTSDDQHWRVDRMTITGTAPVAGGSATHAANGQSVWGRLKYIPRLRGLALLQAWDHPIYFVRTS